MNGGIKDATGLKAVFFLFLFLFVFDFFVADYFIKAPVMVRSVFVEIRHRHAAFNEKIYNPDD